MALEAKAGQGRRGTGSSRGVKDQPSCSVTQVKTPIYRLPPGGLTGGQCLTLAPCAATFPNATYAFLLPALMAVIFKNVC